MKGTLILYYLFLISFYLAEKFPLRKLSFKQASGSMNNVYEKCEQHQNDTSVSASLHNQSHQCDSLSAVSCDQVCNCQQQQSDTYLKLKQDLTQGLSIKSEPPAPTLNLLSHNDHQYQDDKAIVSTQHQEYQADVSMVSSKEYKGL